MNTIADIVVEADLSDVDGLITTLIAREQEIAETLQLVAMRFNLMPQIVAKVICELGIGEPCTGERKEHVDAQYAEMLNQIEAQRQEAIEKYRSAGYAVDIPPFEDPLAGGISTEMTVPDTPDEA